VLLDHQVFDLDGALVYNWDYAADRFPDGVIEDLFAAYGGFLDRLVEDSELWTLRE
jgi:non-ribosomal peptide synthetase component F